METHHLWQFHIELIDSEPPIWRAFQVPSYFTLADLHSTIQLVMGWHNCHSYYFELGDRYGSPDLPNIQDPTAQILGDLNVSPGVTFTYMYDLKSGWLHRLTLTAQPTQPLTEPSVVCLDGALACPPEESNGVWGYEELLDRLADPDEPDYEALLEWVGLDFDPGYFRVDEVNQRLQTARPAGLTGP
jgi:hypothetical protein